MKSLRCRVPTVRRAGASVLLIVAAAALAGPSMGSRWRLEAAACKDVPLRVTLFNTAVVDQGTGAVVTTAIQSDGLGEYVNGIAGLISIKICGGTNDAVVNVTSSKRAFTFGFPAPIPGSVIETVPSWVPGRQKVRGWINVRNITFSKLPFTTRMGATFTASDRATRMHRLVVLDDDAGDHHAYTRFAALAPYTRLDRRQGMWRTALNLETHHKPGALHHAIEPLARRGIDMVQLVSRPIPERPFDYRFDCVLGGHPLDEEVSAALREMTAETARLRVFGSYRADREEGWETVAA